MKTEQSKRVLVSCGTKFHADYMGWQLYKHHLLHKVITAHPQNRFLNRTPLPASAVKFLFPLFGLSYLLNKWLGSQNRFARFVDYRLPALYDSLAARNTGNANVSITWAWAGLKTIKKIKAKKGIAIVEECGSCNAYQNKLLAKEYKSLGLNYTSPTPDFIVQKELREVHLADYILCPSKHVAGSFMSEGIAAEKCVIIPYGVNLNLFKVEKPVQKNFSILFVGTIGVRKGLVYLFKALDILQKEGSIDCLIIGKVENAFKPVFEQYKHLFSHIENVAHNKLQHYYTQASVFVFPSLDEGMAYVQLEAMACGLPVICTPNSGGDSVIDDEVEGFIIPVKNETALAEKITFLKNNPHINRQMGEQAAKKAQVFSWDAYGEKLAAFIQSL